MYFDSSRSIDWVSELHAGRQLQAHSNLIVSLVTVDTLTEVLLSVLEAKWKSVFHVAGREQASYSDTAVMLAKSLESKQGLIREAHVVDQPPIRPIGASVVLKSSRCSDERMIGWDLELPG